MITRHVKLARAATAIYLAWAVYIYVAFRGLHVRAPLVLLGRWALAAAVVVAGAFVIGWISGGCRAPGPLRRNPGIVRLAVVLWILWVAGSAWFVSMIPPPDSSLPGTEVFVKIATVATAALMGAVVALILSFVASWFVDGFRRAPRDSGDSAS